MIRITLLSTKNSPDAATYAVLAKNGDPRMCPVYAFKSFTAVRDKLFRPDFDLFRFSNGRPYGASDVNNIITRLSSHLQLSTTHRLSSHSFRIGGASEADRAGVTAKTIQAMGRWKSDCFLSYIRLDERAILRAQERISSLL